MSYARNTLILVIWSTIFCANANAAFILNGSQQIDSLILTESVTDFYDYDGAMSNTGYEVADTYNFLITEFDDIFYLVGLIDSEDGVDVGRVVTTLSDNSSTPGSFVLIDDSNDVTNVNGTVTDITFLWAAGYSDGFIYEIGNRNNSVDIDIDLSRIVNLSNINLLSFGSASTSNIALSNSFNISYLPTFLTASAPNAFFLFLIGLIGVTVRKLSK